MPHHLADLHWLSILLGALAYFILGAIWYSPLLFVKPWIRYWNIDVNNPEGKKGVVPIMAGSFVLMLLSCIGIALLRLLAPPHNYPEALHIGLLIGVCFSVPAVSIGYLYNKRPLGLHLIDGGYHVVGLTIASAVMHFIG